MLKWSKRRIVEESEVKCSSMYSQQNLRSNRKGTFSLGQLRLHQRNKTYSTFILLIIIIITLSLNSKVRVPGSSSVSWGSGCLKELEFLMGAENYV